MIRMGLFAPAVALAVMGVSLSQPAFGQADDNKLGKVRFETSCKAGSAKAVQPGDAVPAFILVPRVAKGVRGCAEDRSRMRHCLLGYCVEPALQSRTLLRRRPICRSGSPPSRRARPSAPRRNASVTIWTRSGSCTPTTKRSTTARACWPMPKRWRRWRSAIPTTTRRRSTTRLPSTRRPHLPTRPTPTSSKAQRSSSLSPSASRSIQAWRTT